MNLPMNVIRINGYKNGKRTHVDITVRLNDVNFSTNDGKQHSFKTPQIPYDVAQTGFDNGLDAVTSYNYWNWVGQERTTEEIP